MATLQGKNVARAQWANVAVAAFVKEVGGEKNSREDNLWDLLSDLMHWAESKGIDIEKQWESAQEAYLYERENPHE